MIKTGIAGADSLMAGELIRILVNHPDVDLMAACAPGRTGQKVSSVHHGLAGELSLSFSETLDPAGLDVVFIDGHSQLADTIREGAGRWPDLRVIDMSHTPSLDPDSPGMVYGLPEIERRRLVREARRVVVPRSVADAILVSLAPLASHLLLSGPVKAYVKCPEDIMAGEKRRLAEGEAAMTLARLQNSFSSPVEITPHDCDKAGDRELSMEIRLKCTVDLGEIIRLYEETYDDHSFAFITHSPEPPIEVEGTNKVLISLTKPDVQTLRINTVSDCRMRGGAGTATHVLNLLFGLTERTGLALKANAFSDTSGRKA